MKKSFMGIKFGTETQEERKADAEKPKIEEVKMETSTVKVKSEQGQRAFRSEVKETNLEAVEQSESSQTEKVQIFSIFEIQHLQRLEQIAALLYNIDERMKRIETGIVSEEEKDGKENTN